MRIMAVNTVYITPQTQQETGRAHKRRIYDTLLTLLQARSEAPIMRIEKMELQIEWGTIWKNLWEEPIPMAKMAI
jgi:hypothetical protein